MITLFKSSLTLLLFASLVKNGISLTDEDYIDINVGAGEPDDSDNKASSIETGGVSDSFERHSRGTDGTDKYENEDAVMDRKSREPGNHFLRPLRTSKVHFLRTLKKREATSGENGHFLRPLRKDSDEDWMSMIEDENQDESSGKNGNAIVERSIRAPAENMHFLRPLREGSHFLRSLRSPKSHFLRSLRTPQYLRSLRGAAHFLRSLRAPEAHFLRSLRAPEAHFLRSLRAPEAHFLRSLRAPEAHFLRSLRAPDAHFLRSLRAPPSHFLRSLRAPQTLAFLRSLRAPDSHFLRSLRAPDSHFLRSLRAPEAHFLRSLRSSDSDGKRNGHFLRSLRAPGGANFLRSLREDPFSDEDVNGKRDQVSNELAELIPTDEDYSLAYENGLDE